MMKCPRCGFSQPRDQYCAQCGVDILSYKPPQAPLFDRVVQSPLAQLAFVGLIIFFVASSLMKKNDGSLNERVNYLKGNLQISSQKPNSADSNSTNIQKNVAISPPQQETASANLQAGSADSSPTVASTTAQALRARTDSTSVEKAKGTSEGATENKTSHVVKVSYYEITNRVRELLTDESRNTGQFNSYGRDYFAGLLNQFHHRLPNLGKEAILLHSVVKTVENEKSIFWFIGLEGSNPENQIGFRNSLEISELEPGFFRVNFEILKSWKENTDANTVSLVKSSYTLQIEMTKSSACFIGGILLPPTTSEGDDYIASIPPFSILKSPIFRNNRSQLITIIEIEK